MLADVRAVAFDLDGTLVALPVDYEAQRAEIKRRFVEVGIPADWPFKPILAQIDEAAAKLARPDLRAWALGKMAGDELAAAARCRVLPGARDLLDALAARRIPTAIFSRTGRAAVLAALEAARFPPFACVVAREDAKPKPDPESLALCARKLGLAPADVLAVGDHVYDVMAARAAGMRVAAVTTGVSDRASLEERGATIVVGSLAQLVGLLG